MIRVDETDPVGEIEPSFPYRDVTVRKGVDFKKVYDIQSEIGRGKFGTVYRCKEKKTGLILAAKVVNTTRKEDRRAVEREVEIMRRLQHPRLIQLYDAIENGKQIYVVLELIEGGELFERVIDDDFVLTERSCAVFMRQICEGIEFVHSQNILHLDMKPENILCLTKEGNRIKIIDFGLAREWDPKKKLQVLFGTPEFVAPEVVNFDQIGFGTDMWSIGVICYVLLSGLSPFMGDTDVETMANVTIAKYDFDHEAFADISDNAKDFIRCLLVKDISKRASARQCRGHRWLARKPGRAPPRLPPTVTSAPATPTPATRLELDVAKDNLRLFVERWREHPDSPYGTETSPLERRTSRESASLRAHSPSPCGSVCSGDSSEPQSESHQLGAGGDLTSPTAAKLILERRASEGQPRLDPAAQMLLAEEIVRLSEHLRKVAIGQGNSSVPTATTPSKPSNELSEKLSGLARQRRLMGTNLGGRRRSNVPPTTKPTPRHEVEAAAGPQGREVDLTPPWRSRARSGKRRFGETCRDVPRITTLHNMHKGVSLDEPAGAKNLLLKLIDEWGELRRPGGGAGRKSVSVDWCGEDSVARKSISSLAEYFRAEQRKVHR